jgi:threonine aldolase
MIWVEPPDGIRRSLYLGSSERRKPHAVLRRMLDALPEDMPPMGAGDPVDTLQQRVAALLGKEAALLLPTGKMAQQIALRINADRSGIRTFAAHPTCHLVNWELDGYAHVHNLDFQPLGNDRELFTAAHIRAVPVPVSTVVWELPQREIGGLLPDWDTLAEQLRTARDLGARAHLDGARLWEAQTGYDQSAADIAGVFDSVYVSLYKTLEAPRGAVLLGDRSFITEASRWAVRLGGESAGNWPLGAAGLLALDDIVPRMSTYRDHALRMAEAINATESARTVPDVPQTPYFQVELPVGPESAASAHTELCEETGLEVFRTLRTRDEPDTCAFEISITEASSDIAPADVAAFLTELVQRARQMDAAA